MMRIRELRTEKGLTALKLAAIMGVSFQAVGKWERGEAMPRADQLPKLAEAFGCKIDDLYAKGEG